MGANQWPRYGGLGRSVVSFLYIYLFICFFVCLFTCMIVCFCVYLFIDVLIRIAYFSIYNYILLRRLLCLYSGVYGKINNTSFRLAFNITCIYLNMNQVPWSSGQWLRSRVFIWESRVRIPLGLIRIQRGRKTKVALFLRPF